MLLLLVLALFELVSGYCTGKLSPQLVKFRKDAYTDTTTVVYGTDSAIVNWVSHTTDQVRAADETYPSFLGTWKNRLRYTYADDQLFDADLCDLTHWSTTRLAAYKGRPDGKEFGPDGRTRQWEWREERARSLNGLVPSGIYFIAKGPGTGALSNYPRNTPTKDFRGKKVWRVKKSLNSFDFRNVNAYLVCDGGQFPAQTHIVLLNNANSPRTECTTTKSFFSTNNFQSIGWPDNDWFTYDPVLFEMKIKRTTFHFAGQKERDLTINFFYNDCDVLPESGHKYLPLNINPDIFDNLQRTGFVESDGSQMEALEDGYDVLDLVELPYSQDEIDLTSENENENENDIESEIIRPKKSSYHQQKPLVPENEAFDQDNGDPEPSDPDQAGGAILHDSDPYPSHSVPVNLDMHVEIRNHHS